LRKKKGRGKDAVATGGACSKGAWPWKKLGGHGEEHGSLLLPLPWEDCCTMEKKTGRLWQLEKNGGVGMQNSPSARREGCYL
jgi:hypothetical protein